MPWYSATLIDGDSHAVFLKKTFLNIARVVVEMAPSSARVCHKKKFTEATRMMDDKGRGRKKRQILERGEEGCAHFIDVLTDIFLDHRVRLCVLISRQAMLPVRVAVALGNPRSFVRRASSSSSIGIKRGLRQVEKQDSSSRSSVPALRAVCTSAASVLVRTRKD